MKPLLVVLNPRAIVEVEAALAELPIDLLRLVAMTEARIAQRWGEVLELAREHRYSHLIVISDDAVVTPAALAAITDNLHLPVVTGWCNLDATDTRVNLCDEPLSDVEPTRDSYSLPTVWDVLTGPRLRRTYFTGMCLTAMSVELWERFPFRVYGAQRGGWASDYHLSRRLGDAAVPIVAHRDAFVLHLKAEWSQADPTPGRELLIGQVPEDIRLERHGEETV